MVLLLARKDLESVMNMRFCLGTVEEAFRELTLGNVSMPNRVLIALSRHDSHYFLMPAYVHGEKEALVTKAGTDSPNNPTKHGLPTVQAVVLLFDAEKGSLLSIMDGRYFTAMRTGAASGVATNLLARREARTLGVIGTGFQARAQTMAMLEVRKIEKIKAYDIYPEICRKYCDEISERFDVQCACTTNSKEAVVGSDIIVTATTSKTPVFRGSDLADGTHVNSIGGIGCPELEESILKRAKLVVDSKETALKEAPDIINAIKNGGISEDHIHAELGELILGKKTGRTDPKEITVFRTVGVAAEDATTARAVYELAKKRNIGADIAF